MAKSRKKHIHIPNSNLYGRNWWMPNAVALKQKRLLEKEQERERQKNGK